MYINWLYRSQLPLGHTEQYVHDLYDLSIFAEKLCLPILKDKTRDWIQDVALEYDLTDVLYNPALVKKVFEGVSSYWTLQSFCISTMIYCFAMRGTLSIDGTILCF